MEIGEFHGMGTRVLDNGLVKLAFLVDSGPRIVYFSLSGSDENLLAELPDIALNSLHGSLNLWGGHRLWYGPETAVRTYIPDSEPIIIEETETGVHLIQQTEAASGIRKSIEVVIEEGKTAVTLHHHLRNDNLWAVQLAPWAITQIRIGGMAIMPQQVGKLDADGLLPNRQLTFWPYSRLNDERLQLGDEYILLSADETPEAFKIGCMNRQGWLAYLWQDQLFVKRFLPQSDELHVDFGCNCELYTNDRFIELETLAPYQTIEPNETVTHTERWELFGGMTVGDVETAVQTITS